MVLKIKSPKQVTLSLLIEDALESRYKLPHVPFKKYQTVSEVELLLGKRDWLSYAIKSPVLHGVELNGILYFHPKGVVALVRKRMLAKIRESRKAFGSGSSLPSTRRS